MIPQDGWRWAPAWVLTFVALWPAKGIAEGVMVLGALTAIVLLLLGRFRGGSRLLSGPAWALTSVLFFAYWFPQLISSFDAIDRGRALRESLVDLRYLPFLWLAASAVANARGRHITFSGLAIIVSVWTLDALLQVASGTSPLFWGVNQLKQLISGHGMCDAAETAALDRLSGMLGPCNLKLGVVLASLAPFALFAAARRLGALGWSLMAAAVGVVVLLAGARAAWLTYGLVLVFSGWRLLGWKKLLGVFAFGAFSLVLLSVVSPQFHERIERTTQALTADESGVGVGDERSRFGEGDGLVDAEPRCLRFQFRNVVLASALACTRQPQARIAAIGTQAGEQAQRIDMSLQARTASRQQQQRPLACQRCMRLRELPAQGSIRHRYARKLPGIDAARDHPQDACIGVGIVLQYIAAHRIGHADHALATRHHRAVATGGIQAVHGGDETRALRWRDALHGFQAQPCR